MGAGASRRFNVGCGLCSESRAVQSKHLVGGETMSEPIFFTAAAKRRWEEREKLKLEQKALAEQRRLKQVEIDANSAAAANYAIQQEAADKLAEERMAQWRKYHKPGELSSIYIGNHGF